MGEGTDEIRREIEHTRDEMAGTVDELAYKLDVPERAREKARETAEQTGETLRAAAEQAGAATRETAEQARRAAADAARVAGDEIDRSRGRVQTFVRRNPLGAAIGALAVGLVVALVALRR
jgi:hypothetical protein